jgi:hypothetical protein
MCSSGRSVSFSAWSMISASPSFSNFNAPLPPSRAKAASALPHDETADSLVLVWMIWTDLHFGITRQWPLAIGPISMNAKIVSVSKSFILIIEHWSQHFHPSEHTKGSPLTGQWAVHLEVRQRTFDDFTEDTSSLSENRLTPMQYSRC